MKTLENEASSFFYEASYATRGLDAQRRYPNEELCRFISGYLKDKYINGLKPKILEVGCGSGANLWMLVKEGFDTYGLDFSPTAIALCRQVIASYGNANLTIGNMLSMDYGNDCFDAVCDVLAGYCFTHDKYLQFIKEVSRVLRPGGLFFFFTPCVTSMAFINYAPSKKLDLYTLDGILRKDSPYVGNHYPVHFLDANLADEIMAEVGLNRISLQRVTRTYHNLEEPFSNLIGIYAKNIS